MFFRKREKDQRQHRAIGQRLERIDRHQIYNPLRNGGELSGRFGGGLSGGGGTCAQRGGDWARYGDEITRLGEVLRQLQDAASREK